MQRFEYFVGVPMLISDKLPEKIHEQLVHIAKETSEVSQRQYTEDDVRKLQVI